MDKNECANIVAPKVLAYLHVLNDKSYDTCTLWFVLTASDTDTGGGCPKGHLFASARQH